jgi:hypothetical protein
MCETTAAPERHVAALTDLRSDREQAPVFVVRADDAVLPVRSAERLVTLSMMVAASAASGDSDRLGIVAHRYMSALVEHLTAWGRSMCDGPEGLLWATIQLGLLVNARRVIQFAREGTSAARRAQNLVELTERYSKS